MAQAAEDGAALLAAGLSGVCSHADCRTALVDAGRIRSRLSRPRMQRAAEAVGGRAQTRWTVWLPEAVEPEAPAVEPSGPESCATCGQVHASESVTAIVLRKRWTGRGVEDADPLPLTFEGPWHCMVSHARFRRLLAQHRGDWSTVIVGYRQAP
jgi:hypothetical protein